MLANLLRIRYLRAPVFLAVSAVITNYSYDSSLNLSGNYVIDGPRGSDSVGGSANFAYAERPTISYAPVEGEEFSRRLLTPIPIGIIFSLGQLGWNVDILMLMAIQQINDIENMSFYISSPGYIEGFQFLELERKKFLKFSRTIKLLLILIDRDVIEVHRDSDDPSDLPELVFKRKPSPEDQPMVDELRRLLRLDPKLNRFKVTTRSRLRKPNEITIKTRSLLAMMNFVARGIQVPDQHVKEGRLSAFEKEIEAGPAPFRIHNQPGRPATAHIGVRYQDHWFYIDRADTTTKRAFELLLYFYRLLAPGTQGQAPVLTLPTGGR